MKFTNPPRSLSKNIFLNLSLFFLFYCQIYGASLHLLPHFSADFIRRPIVQITRNISWSTRLFGGIDGDILKEEHFEEFVTRPFNDKNVLEIFQKFTHQTFTTNEPQLLYLYGPQGSDKTHLAREAAFTFLKDKKRVLFLKAISIYQYLDKHNFCISPLGRMPAYHTRQLNPYNVIIIDDLYSFEEPEICGAVATYLLHLLCSNKKQKIIITTNIPHERFIDDLKEYQSPQKQAFLAKKIQSITTIL